LNTARSPGNAPPRKLNANARTQAAVIAIKKELVTLSKD